MDWIQTFTGRRFFPLCPKTEDLDIRDIAHALAMKCRFGGHAVVFYSVAEHCVRVSRAVPPADALWGLLHDAAEAYLADVPRPVKRQWPIFGEVEDRLLRVVAGKYGLGWPVPEAVCRADDALLATEARDLMMPSPEAWGLNVTPLEARIEPVDWHEAERLFMARFAELRS